MDEDKLLKLLDMEHFKQHEQRAHSRKISQAVFDHQSLTTLFAMSKKKTFDTISQIISTGKEAYVFHGTSEDGEVAIKIYMVETSDFKNMGKYIRGDPRFSSWRNRRQLVYLWAQKEFKNLSRLQDEIRCPKPRGVHKNVLVMDFIGENADPAPKLKDAELDDPNRTYDEVSDYIKKMYEQRIVHADLSEYNVLYDKGKPVIIDMSTGVTLDHPQAYEFLQRDIRNITNFFQRCGVDADYYTLLKEVMDG